MFFKYLNKIIRCPGQPFAAALFLLEKRQYKICVYREELRVHKMLLT